MPRSHLEGNRGVAVLDLGSSTSQGNDGGGRVRGAAEGTISRCTEGRAVNRGHASGCSCRSGTRRDALVIVGGADVYSYGRLSSSINRQGGQLADHW